MVKLGIVSWKSCCSIYGTKKKCLMLFHAILKERVVQWITSRSTLSNNHIVTLYIRFREFSTVEEDSGREPRTTLRKIDSLTSTLFSGAHTSVARYKQLSLTILFFPFPSSPGSASCFPCRNGSSATLVQSSWDRCHPLQSDYFPICLAN